jgi:hypothetical protein
MKNINPDEAFIAGLIMEIGLLIFLDLFIKKEEPGNILQMEPLEDLLSWERDKYGVDHRQIGEIALAFWKFPQNIINSQKVFTLASSPQEITPMTKLCELARSFSGVLYLENKEFHSLYEEAERSLGMKQDMISDILIATFDQVEEIASNLNVELNKDKDLMSVMEKANYALSLISEKLSGKENISSQKTLPSFDSLQEKETVSFTLQAVAHEIRNPLLAVGGFAKKLSKSIAPGTEGNKYISIILEEAERLEKVLADMTEGKDHK